MKGMEEVVGHVWKGGVDGNSLCGGNLFRRPGSIPCLKTCLQKLQHNVLTN